MILTWTVCVSTKLLCVRKPTKEEVKNRRRYSIPLRELNKCSLDTRASSGRLTPTPPCRKPSQARMSLLTLFILGKKNSPHVWDVPFLLASYLVAWLRWHQCLLPLLCLLASVQVGRPDARERGGGVGGYIHKGPIGNLELPPVADHPLVLCPLELYMWTVGGMEAAHTGRGLCSCRLMQWLIDLEPLYSFTSGFEIQHCTWGAMCVPSLSPFINLSLDLPFPDSPSLPFRLFVSDSVHRLIALDVTCRRWALLTLPPQVPISPMRLIKLESCGISEWEKKNVVAVWMPAGSCQKWSPYLEMA